MKKPLLLTLAFLAFASANVKADTVDLSPIQDNSIYSEDSTQNNGAGVSIFAGRTNGGDLRRALVQFDLSGIPAGSTVTSATLTLTMTRASDTGDRTVSLHRLNEAWGEGTADAGGNEGGGATATPGSATWDSPATGSSTWTDGGNFNATASASESISTVLQPYGFSGPGLTADVAGWVANGSTNHGWIVIGDETLNRTARRFGSREGDPGSAPLLTVVFTPPSRVDGWSLY